MKRLFTSEKSTWRDCPGTETAFSFFFIFLWGGKKKKDIVCILHRMIGWFGLEVAQRSPSTVSCHGQGYLLLDQVAQKPVWSDFKHFQ